MSHFTRITTSISDLPTLQNVLTKLDISWENINIPVQGYQQNQIFMPELVISQPDSVDIGFYFNGISYELIADKSFWQQSVSIETFLDRVNQVYAGEFLNKELETLGFATISYVKTEQGVIDLIAEKWITN